MKNKMKRLVVLMVAILMVVSLCACGADDGANGDVSTPGASKNPGNNDGGNNTGIVAGSYENEEKGITAIYHYRNYEQLVSGIEEIVTKNTLRKTNGQYSNSIWGDEKPLPATPVKFFEGGEELAFWGDDGKFYIRTAQEDLSFALPEDNNLVFYYITEYNQYYFFSIREGNLYFSMQTKNNTTASAEEQVYVAYYADHYIIKDLKITKYNFTGALFTLWLEDGTCYQDHFSGLGLSSQYGIDKANTPTGERVYVLDSSAANVEYDQIYDYGSFDKTHLYSKLGGQDRLYYADAINRENEIAIALPAGYTTADIKEAWIEQHIFVEFKDGSIYYLTDEDMQNLTSESAPASLICHEGLSELGRAGHFRDLVILDLGCKAVALLDDGCLYRVDKR